MRVYESDTVFINHENAIRGQNVLQANKVHVHLRLLSRWVFLQLPTATPRILRRFHDSFAQGLSFRLRLVPWYPQVETLAAPFAV